MENCINHPDKKAEFICHGCGKHYCELCITEGNEHYYCNDPGCQKMLQAEPKSEILPAEITCPNCKSILLLENDERESRIIHCPECEALIDFTVSPPIIKNREEYSHMFSSLNQGDIALIKSLLDTAGIDYYVFGENFLSIDPLIQPVRFFILNTQIDEAKKLLKNFDSHIYGVSARNSDKE
jgi:transcription elongation factor Elf1